MNELVCDAVLYFFFWSKKHDPVYVNTILRVINAYNDSEFDVIKIVIGILCSRRAQVSLIEFLPFSKTTKTKSMTAKRGGS